MIPLGEITNAIRAGGLFGRVLCIHSSFRSFGDRVEGGPDALLDALLAEGCTLVVPTFSYSFQIAPPPNMHLPRNGCDYSGGAQQPATPGTFTPGSNEISKDMGALPRAVLRRAERVRGNHPINSFSAIGPLAGELIRDQAPLHVYAPLEGVISREGAVLLIGVGLETMTMLHLAEQRAGRTLFRRWARGHEGQTMTMEVGSCSDGFPRLEAVLEPLALEVHVGASRWRIFPAAETLQVATDLIRDTPDITRCANPNCERCRDAILGGPIL